MERDDIYEYSLDTHHSEEEGKKVRKKIFWVLGLLSAVTIIEVALGLHFSGDPANKEWLKYTFICMTLFKAGYIVMVFMHLGDEKKNLRMTILAPYMVLIGYLIYIALTEALYVSHTRPTVETHYPVPAHESKSGEHSEHGE